jgi:enoyl-CoA hydratase
MLHISRRDAIALLRLEHGKAHALDLELVRAIADSLTELERDDTIRACVLTGTGGIFSAGVDLHRLLDGGAAYAREFVPAMVDAFRRLFAFSRPSIAAINGHAIAGGCVLAAACDVRVMARGRGTVGVPELHVGVPFPLVAIEILRFATSAATLQELVYRGKTFGVEDAQARGLIDEVVEPHRLLERACEVAEEMSFEPVSRFRITKRQIRGPALAAMAAHAAETDAEVIREWQRPETIAAIRAYLDRLKQAKDG